MTKRKRTKRVHDGKYVAEMQIHVEYDETAWLQHLPPEDA